MAFHKNRNLNKHETYICNMRMPKLQPDRIMIFQKNFLFLWCCSWFAWTLDNTFYLITLIIYIWDKTIKGDTTKVKTSPDLKRHTSYTYLFPSIISRSWIMASYVHSCITGAICRFHIFSVHAIQQFSKNKQDMT